MNSYRITLLFRLRRRVGRRPRPPPAMPRATQTILLSLSLSLSLSPRHLVFLPFPRSPTFWRQRAVKLTKPLFPPKGERIDWSHAIPVRQQKRETVYVIYEVLYLRHFSQIRQLLEQV